MEKFELDYASIITEVLLIGDLRKTRNATTKARFGYTLKVSVENNFFPLIQGRKMYTKGVFGELAAMLRQPTNIKDFKDWGCNYWDAFADNEAGDIRVDYGNKWFNFNGVDQIADLKHKLANDKNDRAMLITGWDPANLNNLSLRCCHHTYQFFVEGKKLHMSWHQRSVDLMVGLPSDIAFAAAWLIAVAKEFNLRPGDITMFLGDCHIYSQHFEGARQYLDNVYENRFMKAPTYIYEQPIGADFCTFDPQYLKLSNFDAYGKIDLELIP